MSVCSGLARRGWCKRSHVSTHAIDCLKRSPLNETGRRYKLCFCVAGDKAQRFTENKMGGRGGGGGGGGGGGVRGVRETSRGTN